MQYQKSQRQILQLIAVTLFLSSVIAGQVKDDEGYLFGNVVFAAEKQGDYATPAIGVVIEIKSKYKTLQITTNGAGLIDEKLPKGVYYLLAARTLEGVLLDFKADQYKSFRIKSNKTERFDIAVLKPGTKVNAPTNIINEPESISFCDLLKTPDSFSGRTVRTSAIYRYGYEASDLFCVNCSVSTRILAERRKSTETKTNKKIRNRIKWNDRGKIVVVTAVGQLSNAGNYGHMGRYKYQFVIDYFESADVILNDSPLFVPDALKECVMCACKAEKTS